MKTFKHFRYHGIILFCLAIMMFCMPMTAYASQLLDTVYVSGTTGDDSNAGTVDAPVKMIEKALELVADGGTISIVDSTSSDQPSADEPLCIEKNVTISGGSITLKRAGIVLGADVTLQNVSLNFTNAVRNAIVANGYTLALENVKSVGNYPVHLFCGEVTGYTGTGTLPEAGGAGAVIISGSGNSLGDVFAGSLSEYGAVNCWDGSAAITFAPGAGGEFGSVYAHGAMESRGEGTGDIMKPDSTSYTVAGDVSIQLSGSKPAMIDGATGESSNAAVTVAGGANLISTLQLSNIKSLTVAAGNIAPTSLNSGLDVAVHSGAVLDLSVVLEEDPSFTVNDFSGGGTLVIDSLQMLEITGNISGITEFRTPDYYSSQTETSGQVEYLCAYIDVTNAQGDGSFIFKPHYTQAGATLNKLEENGVIAWTTSDYVLVKPDQFEVGEVSYHMSLDDILNAGLNVPVSFGQLDNEYYGNIPLTITIAKDGEAAVSAEEEFYNGFYYSVASLGFEEIFCTESEDGLELLFYGDYFTIQNGVYEISISVTLADDSVVTKEITLAICDGVDDNNDHNCDTCDGKIDDCYDTDGNEICDVCGKYMDGIGAKLAGYTLSLNGNIGVNFYMELSDAIIADAGAYMKFTLPNGSTEQVPIAKASQNSTMNPGTTYYVFSCEVASDEMTGDIKAQMYDGNGNGGTEYTYTVRDYAEYIINHPAAYSEGAVAFAKALLNYGTRAQEYFNYAVDDKANKNLTEADKSVTARTAESLSQYKVSAVSDEAIGGFAGCKLVLDAETTLKVYFDPIADVEGLSFSVAGENIEKPYVQSGDYVVLSKKNIKAWDLNTVYEFVASDGTESITMKCSVMAYCYNVLNNQSAYSEELVNLVLALCDFWEKSEIYAPN